MFLFKSVMQAVAFSLELYERRYRSKYTVILKRQEEKYWSNKEGMYE